MSLITIILVLAIVGLILYLLNRYLPMDEKIKTILNWVVVVVVLIWLLQAFGLLGRLHDIKV